jgi:hypothetical protein
MIDLLVKTRRLIMQGKAKNKRKSKRRTHVEAETPPNGIRIARMLRAVDRVVLPVAKHIFETCDQQTSLRPNPSRNDL